MNNLDPYREAGNPLFNDNKLKLGIFGPNCSNACAMTLAETTFAPSFQNSVDLARLLEAGGFECIVPIARWRGFGGPSNFNGVSLETYTWAAALAAVTRGIFLFATSHVPTVHPIMAAKMAATIDQVSQGRFGLNIVCGWFPAEMEMFGVKMMEHDTRYEYAAEWVEVVERLWTEHCFDHRGRFFTIRQGMSDPKPHQRPRPLLICAGTSPKGREFAARYCDINFGLPGDVESARRWVGEVTRLAATTYRREIGTFMTSYAVVRDTEKEAQDYYRYYVHEKGDWEAANNACKSFGIESASCTPEYIAKHQENFIAGWGGFPLVGTPEQVTDKLLALSRAGVGGTLVSMVDYNVELPYWNERVRPLLEQAGLRKPVATPAPAIESAAGTHESGTNRRGA